MEPQQPGTIAPPATVLLVGASSIGGPACCELCERGERRVEVRVKLNATRPERPPSLPGERLGVVWLPPTGASDPGEPAYEDRFTVAAFEDPADLPRCGLAVSTFCEEWGRHDTQVVVCFDAFEKVLERVDTERAFHFLDVLTRRMKEVGALAHVHLDPQAVDRQTAAAFSEIVDAVVVEDTVAEPTGEEASGPDPSPVPETDLVEATDEDVATALESV